MQNGLICTPFNYGKTLFWPLKNLSNLAPSEFHTSAIRTDIGLHLNVTVVKVQLNKSTQPWRVSIISGLSESIGSD